MIFFPSDRPPPAPHYFFESKRQTQKRIKRVTAASAYSSLPSFTKIEKPTSQMRGQKYRSANNALGKWFYSLVRRRTLGVTNPEMKRRVVWGANAVVLLRVGKV